jgi:phosphate transport system substrate-binding protein
VKHLTALGVAAVLAIASLLPASAQEVFGTTNVTGAGSTFAYPIIAKWSESFLRSRSGGDQYRATGGGLDEPATNTSLDYESIGSLGGTLRVRGGFVDFAATDAPLKSDELEKLGLAQFPIVIGGVVAVVNIDGIGPGELKLTGPLLADIFLGKVSSWSDSTIKLLNPGLKLPDAKLAVIHRSDGSGTTYNFAHFLAKVSPQWRDKVGVETLLSWPTGQGAKGNEGAAAAVQQTKNSIGYVEYTQAILAKLSTASIQNRAGNFIVPNNKTFQSAAASANWNTTSDFYLILTDPPGDDAYPIAATVFVLMQKKPGRLRNQRAALDYFQWALENGARDAASLGYVPLPNTLVRHVMAYLAKNLKS